MKKVKLERAAVRLYSRRGMGRGVMAIQYENEFEVGENDHPDRNPIYVGFDGEAGQPLDEVLEELYRFRRTFNQVGPEKIVADLYALSGRVLDLEAKRRRPWILGRS